MKALSLHYRRAVGRLGWIFPSAALLLGGALMADAQQFNSPAGTWDFVLSGSGQQGVAFLTFLQASDAGGTFYGYQLITAPQNPASSGSDGRNSGGNPGRGDSTSPTNSASTNVFGFSDVKGPWEFDNKGRVQGFFYQVLNSSGPVFDWLDTCVTGFIPYTTLATNGTTLTNKPAVMELSFCLSSTNAATNVTWSAANADGTTNEYLAEVSLDATNVLLTLLYTDFGPAGITNSATNFLFTMPTNNEAASIAVSWINANLSGTNVTNTSTFTFTPNFTAGPGNGTSTNSVSFVGKVVPGKRFNLTSYPSLNNGKVTYLGVPYQTDLPDLSGNWSGTKTEAGKRYLEFFSLKSVAQLGASYFATNGSLIGPAITNFPSIYYGEGSGPGFGLGVFTLLSAQKKIGFHFETVPDGSTSNALMSATYGTFVRTASGGRAATRGIEEPDTNVLFNGTLFNAP
jgi:hypothetical protein